jgi:hypothetical protein
MHNGMVISNLGTGSQVSGVVAVNSANQILQLQAMQDDGDAGRVEMKEIWGNQMGGRFRVKLQDGG